MNWDAILQYAISGALVSWPVFIGGLWAAHVRTKQHIDRATQEQTEQIAEMTREQTGELERRRSRQPGRTYHGHGDAHP